MNSLAAGIGRTSVLGHCVAVVLLCGSAASVSSATNSSQFAVTATFVSADNPTQPKSAICQTTPALAFGAFVTVVCATGEVVSIAPQPGAAPGVPTLGRVYQVVMSRTFAPGLSVSSNTSSESGMVSNTRMVQVDGQNYYELLVAW